MHRDAYTCHKDYYEIHLGITSKYIDRHQTASMTNNPPSGYHPNNPWVLSCKQQIIALSKVRNVRIQISLDKGTAVLSLVATEYPQP